MADPNVSVGIRLHPATYKSLKAQAARRKITFSEAARRMLDPNSIRLSRDVAEDLLVLLDERLLEDEAGAGLKTLRSALWDALEK